MKQQNQREKEEECTHSHTHHAEMWQIIAREYIRIKMCPVRIDILKRKYLHHILTHVGFSHKTHASKEDTHLLKEYHTFTEAIKSTK